jgi:hypothetical protein
LAGKEVSILDNIFALAGVAGTDVYTALDTQPSKLIALIQVLTNGDLGSLTNAQLNFIATILNSAQIQLLTDLQLDDLTQTQLNGLVPNMGATQWALLSSGQKVDIISILTACEVSVNLTQAKKNQLNYRTPLAHITTLPCNNSFGNTNRFTDEVGGQTYANNIVIDHLYNLYWVRTPQSTATHAAAIVAAAALTVGGISSWRLPTFREIASIYQDTFGNKLNYAPFNYSASAIHWTATDGATSVQAQTYNPNAVSFATTSKAGSNIYLVCKTYQT